MIRLIARMPLTYQDRAVRPGEVFEATPIDAAVLTYSPSLARPAKARFAPPGAHTCLPDPVGVTAPASTSTESEMLDEEADEKPRRRRTYRRRDLVAEED